MKFELRSGSLAAIFGLLAGLLTFFPGAADASGSLTSKFQAQSPTSVFIPANQAVPVQGSTVTLSFDRADFLGNGANANYASALSTSTTATVTKVIADFGYRAYADFTALGSNGELGYLVLLDFGSGRSFNFAYVGTFQFAQAATQIDATGVTGLFSYQDGSDHFLWAPSSLSSQVGVVTAVISSWAFTTSNAITATASNVTLDCTKVNSNASGSCQALVSKVGYSLKLTYAPASGNFISPTTFVGFVGLQSSIQNGLVQVSAPIGGSSNNSSNQVSQVKEVRYEGPEFSELSQKSMLPNLSYRLSGKKLDEITALSIAGKQVSFSATTDSVLITLPAGIEPGLYDLIVESSHGKLTQGSAISVRTPLKVWSYTTKSLEKVSEDDLLEHFYVSKVQDSELSKARCIVNSKSLEQALTAAKRLCALVRAGNASITETVVEARSTVKGNMAYARVVYGWPK